ncbi:hypothetical protein GO491_07180 [Flavobacteriaceae bacterium Ap0902]|nr:hypothetical protein [Flavobacteriaceae bacterium Ap0902]
MTNNYKSLDEEHQNDIDFKYNENRQTLGKLSELDILKIFNEFTRGKNKRQVIIPVGFPQAGKSFLLSSLFYYSRKATERNWKANFENKEPFNDGFLSVNTMVDYFQQKKQYPQTISGTVDIIGVRMEPSRRNLPVSEYAFIDLAGEDLKEIKVSNQGKFGDQINGILKSIAGSRPIFLLITPYEPALGDHDEDTLHSDFLNHLKMNLTNLFNESIFVVIVSQWDKNPNRETDSVEEYIEQNRPQLYGQIQNSNTVYGEYSVADITTGKDNEGNEFIFFQQINKEYPKRLWDRLYKISTGKDLSKSWWEKLFG